MSTSSAGWLVVLLLLAAPSPAQTLAANSDFDVDVTAWILREGSDLYWVSDDVQGCGGSGSARAASQEIFISPGFSVHVAAIVQCVAFAGIDPVTLALHVRAPSGTQMFLSFHQSADCSDESPVIVSAALGQTFEWQQGDLSDVDVPEGTQSVRLGIEALSSADFDYELGLDRVFLGAAKPIFRDDFEGDLNDATVPCRWEQTAN